MYAPIGTYIYIYIYTDSNLTCTYINPKISLSIYFISCINSARWSKEKIKTMYAKTKEII